ncbi:recombinase family protein [Mycolicibacterium vaccae]|uniref:Recombinase n=2 Tax=Mycolicibacterium vaccae TaxID=1810 RepID=K0V3U4_MYCVA|nr:recombinase family protein [Mycolicibacterium vaccae]EJZ09468.1 recombinase [Mycolicibacterium vaccae ATCC 25954]
MTANTKTPIRAGCYLRISSDPNDKRKGIDRQREDVSALCEAKGWDPAEFYIDNDRSASNGKERPKWDKLLSDIKAGKRDAIAAWSLDRGWRMMSELETLREFFAGIDRPILLSTNRQGDIDLDSPSGVLMAQMNTSFAEHEIAVMKVRMRRAARQKAERGIPQWRHAFGYTSGEHTAECAANCRNPHHRLDPVTAPLVDQVYRDVLAGGSITDAAQWLNNQSAFGLTGKPWSASTLSLFLRSPRNAGLRAHNDVIVTDTNDQPVKGTWPALVSESTWYATQSKISAGTRTVMTKTGPRLVRQPGTKSVRRHILTGVMQCGKCGDGRLNGKWAAPRHGSNDAGHEIVYSCKDCRGCAIRANDVEPLLHEIVSDRLGRADAGDLLVNKAHDSTEAERIRTERAVLLTQIETANREYDDGIIDGARLKGRTERAKEKLAELDRCVQDQERLRVLDGLPLGNPAAILNAVKDLTADRFRAVLDLLLEITVLPVGRGSHNRTFNPDRVHDGLVWKV